MSPEEKAKQKIGALDDEELKELDGTDLDLHDYLAAVGIVLQDDHVIVNGVKMTLIEWLFPETTQEHKGKNKN